MSESETVSRTPVHVEARMWLADLLLQMAFAVAPDRHPAKSYLGRNLNRYAKSVSRGRNKLTFGDAS